MTDEAGCATEEKESESEDDDEEEVEVEEANNMLESIEEIILDGLLEDIIPCDLRFETICFAEISVLSSLDFDAFRNG